MGSLYLNNLSTDDRKLLESRLLEGQDGKCFICESEIENDLHDGALDIDHIEPLKIGDKDDPQNFALTHYSCNRSKQASNLRVARILARFEKIKEIAATDGRSANLGDILSSHNGAKFELPLKLNGKKVSFSYPQIGKNEVLQENIHRDEVSEVDYFFAKIPIEYLHHDDRINPRAIGSSLHGLVEEFHKKRPQLHVSLAYLEMKGSENKAILRVFDGQHKATAQILLGMKELPVRVFINPNVDNLLTANTNAGTTLRQVAFDKSVQRHLGSSLFLDRIDRYRKELNLPENALNFSEKDLVDHFRGEWREMRKYILDATRNSITHHPENKLKDYIEFGGKGKDKPLSYSAIEKTFYSFFIFSDVLQTPLDYRLEEQENPRELEKEQILKLMNLIADKIFIGKFDPAVGATRVENKVLKNDDIPEAHLIAFRLSKEEILYVWLRYIKSIIRNHFDVQPKS